MILECKTCSGQGLLGSPARFEEGGIECHDCQGSGEEHCDQYGNPLSGDRIINCCFPDCGCDGARLCMAENGASGCACVLNVERGNFNAHFGIKP
jgi:hypothetical protein